LLFRMSRTVVRRRRGLVAFVRAFPLTALLTLFWACGEALGYLTATSADHGSGVNAKLACPQTGSQ
jgi:hypothetical protein